MRDYYCTICGSQPCYNICPNSPISRSIKSCVTPCNGISESEKLKIMTQMVREVKIIADQQTGDLARGIDLVEWATRWNRELKNV
jgi:hypothetical protein